MTIHPDPAKSLKSSDQRKRTDDLGDALTPIISQLTLKLTQLEAELDAVRTSVQTQGGSSAADVYTRWGNKGCPAHAELVYTGFVGGSYSSHAGAAATPLCLPPNPVYPNGTGTPSGAAPPYHAFLYGAEYETAGEPYYNLEPSCAVCHVPRATHLMLPATDACPAGWTREYWGFLMANAYHLPGASEYVCVDSAFDYLPGTQANSPSMGWFYTLSVCGSLACPPFVKNRVVLCAVCSK